MLFGQPSTTDRWGFSIYGHHLAINADFQGNQIVLTPTFTGAEPNEIDDGSYKGKAILSREEHLGLKLMTSLSPTLQSKAQIFADVNDKSFAQEFETSFPQCRWNPADQRHLCGAFQDNRIVPYEGVLMSELDDSLREILLDTVAEFIVYLPEQARRNRLQQVKTHMNETYFSWIGGFGDNDAFYYRIQSPVVICEFDHHSGVFLVNPEPAKFHIHTIVRSPNGGDYGMARCRR